MDDVSIVMSAVIVMGLVFIAIIKYQEHNDSNHKHTH